MIWGFGFREERYFLGEIFFPLWYFFFYPETCRNVKTHVAPSSPTPRSWLNPFLVLYPVNPATAARYRQAFKTSRAKSDPSDAQVCWY